MNAPTPELVLDQIVQQFGPQEDPSFPIPQKDLARKRLAAQMLQHAFGPSHPLSYFVKAYLAYEVDLSPTYEKMDDVLERMTDAWEAIQQDLEAEMESYN